VPVPDPALADRVPFGRGGTLEAIVFVSGGVRLALEIVASRVLAPYSGNSIYVVHPPNPAPYLILTGVSPRHPERSEG
jgi:hypothetical protein